MLTLPSLNMSRVNILYVITKLELGGAQKQLLSLLKALDKTRFNVFLFTACEGLLMEDALSLDQVTLRRSRFLERPIRPLKDLLALIEIWLFIKKNKITVVHTHSSKAGLIGRWAASLAGVKLIIHSVHGWPFHRYQTPLAQFCYRWLEGASAGITDKIIVVSEHDLKTGLKNKIGDRARYQLIRYGIDYKDFSSLSGQPVKEELGILPDELVVGNISCFKPQKSLVDFIKAAFLVHQEFPRAKFLLVGDGSLRNSLQKLINKLNLQNTVILAGWRRDIPRVLAAMDIIALSSLWEGLPIAVIEALAASKPVVATDTGGIREVLRDGKTGFLSPCRNAREMSAKLLSLLWDEGLRKQMGSEAGKSLDLNLRKMVETTEAMYADLLGLGGDVLDRDSSGRGGLNLPYPAARLKGRNHA